MISLTLPRMPRKPSRAGVDAPLPLDELVQRLGIQFVLVSVAHDARPLAPGPFVDLDRVGSAPNDGSERIFPIGHL